jgi:LSD1 subclass zinc finger protein
MNTAIRRGLAKILTRGFSEINCASCKAFVIDFPNDSESACNDLGGSSSQKISTSKSASIDFVLEIDIYIKLSRLQN